MKLNLAIPGLLIALLVGCNDTTTTVAPTVSPSATANPTSNPVTSEPTPTATPTPVTSEPTPTATPTPVTSEPTPTATPTPVASEPKPTPKPTITPVVSEKTQTSTPTATNSPNPFDSVSFPKASCGDEVPTNGTTNTVNLYPVFIDYSDSNLQAIKTNYCGDALQTIRKDSGKKAIQVGSFTSEERANQFKEFLGNKLSSVNADVGEPTVIAVKPKGDVKPQGETANKSTSISSSASSIGKAAQLTPKQIKELIEMENRLTVRVDQSNLKLKKVKAILPTYVPPGFEVKDFRISPCNSSGAKSGRYIYYITYSNSSDTSFSIQNQPCSSSPFYSKPTVVKDIQIPSTKFAQINLQMIKFDRSSDNTKISGEILSSNPESPGSFQKLLSLTSDGSNPVNWQEAQKIIKSMDYLNQN